MDKGKPFNHANVRSLCKGHIIQTIMTQTTIEMYCDSSKAF